MRSGFAPLLLVVGAMTAGPVRAAPWTLDVGIATSRLPDYPGSATTHTRILPLVEGTWGSRLAFSLDDGLRWTAYKARWLKLGPVGEFRQHDVSTHAAGVRHNGDAVELGGFVEVDTPVAAVEARMRRAVTGYRGTSADVAVDTGGEIRAGTTILLEARVAWAGDRFVRSRYGDELNGGPSSVSPPPHFLSAGAQLAASQRIGKNLEAVVVASDDRLIGALRGAPIQTRILRQLTLGFRRRFSG